MTNTKNQIEFHLQCFGGTGKQDKQLLSGRTAIETFLPAQIGPVRYHYLNPANNTVHSVSHTRTKGHSPAVQLLGLITASRQNLTSIGLDMEFTHRLIKASSARHFIREEDQLGPLTLLQAWCIKEACFKCLAPLLASLCENPFAVKHPFDLVLKDIVITSLSSSQFKFALQSDHHKFPQYLREGRGKKFLQGQGEVLTKESDSKQFPDYFLAYAGIPSILK